MHRTCRYDSKYKGADGTTSYFKNKWFCQN